MKQYKWPNPEQVEWAYAKSVLSRRGSYDYLSKREEVMLHHDFMRIDNAYYALGNQSIGKGGYGKVLGALDENHNRWVCKVTFPEGCYQDMPFPESLFKRMGFIKGVTALNQYEQETLFSLGLGVKGSYEAGSHITIMRPLGLPLCDYVQKNKVSSSEALHLALKTVRALYDFHTGFSDTKRVARLHNDIKPGNVLIEPDSQSIALIDFSECFEIDAYEPLRIYRHPRATSFEPFIAAPEVRYQTGPWYKPWQQYRHTNRDLSIQSDVYLLGSVLKCLSRKHIFIKKLSKFIMHPNRALRPTEPILLLVLMYMTGEFEKHYERLIHEYALIGQRLPGFDDFQEVSANKVKRLCDHLIQSDGQAIDYDSNLLSTCF